MHADCRSVCIGSGLLENVGAANWASAKFGPALPLLSTLKKLLDKYLHPLGPNDPKTRGPICQEPSAFTGAHYKTMQVQWMESSAFEIFGRSCRSQEDSWQDRYLGCLNKILKFNIYYLNLTTRRQLTRQISWGFKQIHSSFQCWWLWLLSNLLFNI